MRPTSVRTAELAKPPGALPYLRVPAAGRGPLFPIAPLADRGRSSSTKTINRT